MRTIALLLAAACSAASGPAVEGAPVAFAGSCAGAKPLEDPGRYLTQVRIASDTPANVRSDAVFAQDADNRLGTIDVGVVAWAEGPLKDAEVSAGIGYAIAVVDASGQSCRGYVSATVVEVLPPG